MPTTRLSGRRVLVAEDDNLVLESLRARLYSAGYDVHVARDGAEAMQRMRILKPDALVLDLMMPEMDGFGVLEAMRDEPDEQWPRVLVLTSRQTAEDVKRALSLGAQDYVVKSRADSELLNRIERMLNAV